MHSRENGDQSFSFAIFFVLFLFGGHTWQSSGLLILALHLGITLVGLRGAPHICIYVCTYSAMVELKLVLCKASSRPCAKVRVCVRLL